MSLRLPRSASIRVSAVDTLRKALMDGRFGPGESLSEPALASQMGVSRGPVREALLVLEQEGLVVYNQNRGFSVLTIGSDDRLKMVKVRIPLEALALESAKGRASDRDRREMRAAAERMVASYDSDPRASARADLAFHEQLWALTENPWLVAALRRISVPFFLFAMMYRVESRVDTATLENQHQAYLDYLEGTTSLTAEECVRLHLRTYDAA